MSKPEASVPQFQFVGSSESGTTEKITWPVLAQGLIIRANVIGKLSATAAFEAGVREYNEMVEAGEVEGNPLPTDLPPSYTNKNAGSVLYGLKQRFLTRANKPDARGHQETLEVAEQLGIIQPQGETATVESDDSDDDSSES